MSILTLQKRLAELGRIRLGDTEAATSRAGNSYQRPVKLDTFRLTSPARLYIDTAAQLWGGEVEPWEDGEGNPQWQVVTEAREIRVFIPPVADPISQYMEMWDRGGCQRRCDRVTELLQYRPCVCPADEAERAEMAQNGEACKPVTRVRLVIPELGGVGIWMLTSNGSAAASEFGGLADLLEMYRAQGNQNFVGASLRLERRAGKQGDIFVPVLSPELSMADVVGAAALEAHPAPPALPRSTQRVEIPTEGVPRPPEGDAAAWASLDGWRRVAAELEIGSARALKVAREVAHDNGFPLPSNAADLDSLDEHLADLFVTRLREVGA